MQRALGMYRSPLIDKEALEQRIDRYRKFFTAEIGTLLLIEDEPWSSRVSERPLERWDLPRQWKEYTDRQIDAKRRFWVQRTIDDLLPSIHPYYGIAEHSSFFGGTVEYGGDTSYHQGNLVDLENISTMKYSSLEPHYKMMLDTMSYLKQKSNSTGLFSALRGAESPLDIAQAVRGNDLFLDTTDNPDAIHRLLQSCTDALKWNLDNQLERIDRIQEGLITGLGIWIPGRSVGHISEDISSMCSPRFYEQFGLPYSHKALKHYEGTMIHIHGLGSHQLPLICQLPKLLIIQIEADPNQPTPLEILRKHEKILRDKIIMMRTSPKEFYDNQDFLRNRRTILQIAPSGTDQAHKLVSYVRAINR